MDRREAFDLLGSDDALDRLRAARALRDLAEPEDQEVILGALKAESDAWVRAALSQIENRETAVLDDAPAERPSEDTEQLVRDIRAQTTQALTEMVHHELEPLVGALDVSCKSEVHEFEQSRANKSLTGIKSFLNALRALNQASSVPSVSEFNLSDTIVESISTVVDERDNRGLQEIHVHTVRDDVVPVLGDRDLVRLVLVNLLRNALESTDSLEGEATPVIVNWGKTDLDVWIAVLDQGVGLPHGASRMSEAGVTTKDKNTNSGMGLAVCEMALKTMNGQLTHRPRERGGVVAEMRWTEGKDIDARTSG